MNNSARFVAPRDPLGLQKNKSRKSVLSKENSILSKWAQLVLPPRRKRHQIAVIIRAVEIRAVKIQVVKIRAVEIQVLTAMGDLSLAAGDSSGDSDRFNCRQYPGPKPPEDPIEH